MCRLQILILNFTVLLGLWLGSHTLQAADTVPSSKASERVVVPASPLNTQQPLSINTNVQQSQKFRVPESPASDTPPPKQSTESMPNLSPASSAEKAIPEIKPQFQPPSTQSASDSASIISEPKRKEESVESGMAQTTPNLYLTPLAVTNDPKSSPLAELPKPIGPTQLIPSIDTLGRGRIDFRPVTLETEAPVLKAEDAKLLQFEIGKGALIKVPQPVDTVFVANPEIADVQAKTAGTLYIYGKSPGETVLYAVGANDNVLMNSRVIVRHNLVGLKESLTNITPGSNIEVSTSNTSVVLSGQVTNAQQVEDARRMAVQFAGDAKNVVNQLQVTGPNQINLRVRVAEVSRLNLKELGFNTDLALQYSEFAVGLFTGASLVQAGSQIFNSSNVVRQPSFFGQGPTNSINTNYRAGHVSLDHLIDALATEGLVQILAEPNLVAISGETASFLAGGEFPIPVAQENDRTTITYRQFGVSLSFTPTLLDGDRISMRVRPEVSELSDSGAIRTQNISIPALTVRRAETSVELGSGQSFAIAGLLQKNQRQNIAKFPWLGDLPILGALFRSDRFQRDETELIIVITPYIVRPVSAKNIVTPVDGLRPTNDIERILLGQTQRATLPTKTNAPLGRQGQKLIGPAGFILE